MNADEINGAEPYQPERLECIDGLRGWAAIMVLLSHLWGQFARHVVPLYDNPFLRAISDGHIAVLIFFVLSGVALSLRFVRTEQRISVVRLVAARYVRLVVPILATTLIVYLLISLHVSGSADAAQLAHSEIFLGARHDRYSSLGEVFSFSFYSVLFNYDPQATFNWSLWTMPIEFEGSLLIFGLLFLFSRLPGFTPHRRLMTVGALTIVLLIFSKQLSACFTAGFVLSELVHVRSRSSRWWRWIALAFMAASFATIAKTGRKDDTSGALLAVGVVMAVLFWPSLKNFFSNSLSRWLGRISFPLYLIHVPLIGAAGALYVMMRHNDVPANLATHATVLLAFAGCLLAARLLLPVERLSIRWSRAVGRLKLPHRSLEFVRK